MTLQRISRKCYADRSFNYADYAAMNQLQIYSLNTNLDKSKAICSHTALLFPSVLCLFLLGAII